ncbi:MAG: hypothetical protein IRY96_06400 [Burkholderiales bacterium]|nr:hypothetical protein [Burkholderiales bacterium]
MKTLYYIFGFIAGHCSAFSAWAVTNGEYLAAAGLFAGALVLILIANVIAADDNA